MSNYAYLFPLSKFSTDLQRKALKGKATFKYIFNEEESQEIIQRNAFQLLLNHLKPNDKVYVYTYWCLSNEDRLSFVLLDVVTRIAAIHEKGASVLLIDNHIDTSNPQGRFNLSTLVATSQYLYEIKKEESKTNSSSECSCSSNYIQKVGC